MEHENFFNINTLLKNVFQTLDQSCQERSPDLVFVFGRTVPCQFKGNSSTLYMVLVKILCKVLKNGYSKELLISVDAPEEFIYKEPVTFKITNIPLKKEEIVPYLKETLSKELSELDASIEYTENNGGSLELILLLTTAELGCRRHYRLPSKLMLNKDILLVVESNNVALSLTKMFKYFPMNIDLCIKQFKEERYDLSHYDLVLIEDSLFDFQFQDLIVNAKEKRDVKFVLFGNEDIYDEEDESKLHSAFLAKPVTQESIYQLLITLFDELPILT